MHLCEKVHVLLTPSIFVAQVGKSPNIGKVHREANDRQEKVYFLSPSFSVVLGSGTTCAVTGSWNDGGTGVLDTILVLYQYQFYLLFLHIALFQWGHRRKLVLRHDLDIHLLWCVRCPRWPGALTAPCGFSYGRLSEPVRLEKEGNHADKRDCCPTRLQLIHPRTWAGEEGRETEDGKVGDVRKVSLKLRTARNTGYDCQAGISGIIPFIASGLGALCCEVYQYNIKIRTSYLL